MAHIHKKAFHSRAFLKMVVRPLHLNWRSHTNIEAISGIVAQGYPGLGSLEPS